MFVALQKLYDLVAHDVSRLPNSSIFTHKICRPDAMCCGKLDWGRLMSAFIIELSEMIQMAKQPKDDCALLSLRNPQWLATMFMFFCHLLKCQKSLRQGKLCVTTRSLINVLVLCIKVFAVSVLSSYCKCSSVGTEMPHRDPDVCLVCRDQKFVSRCWFC